MKKRQPTDDDIQADVLIGANLYRLMKEKKKRYKDVAESIGYKESAIYTFVRGSRPIKARSLVNLSKLFGGDYNAFFEERQDDSLDTK